MEYNQINEIFLKQKLEVTLFPTTEQRKFESFQEFENFINADAEAWKGIVQHEISSVLPNFQAVQRYINQIKTTQDEATVISLFRSIKQQINQPHTFISSETEEAQIILRLAKQNQMRGNAAYKILVQKNMVPVHQNIDNMMAAIECIKFLQMQEGNKVKEKEEKNLDELKARHHRTITEIKSDYENFKNEYLNELNKAKSDFESCNLAFTTKNDQNDKAFQSKLDEYHNKLIELEKTYGEKLRLSKPVEYWKGLQQHYEKKGKSWVHWSIGISSIFLLFLIGVFYFFPEWLKGTFGPNQLKGLIIFTIIVSIFSYLLHLFIKLANSAYHLSRDAEERRQLTHVYLALMKEKAVDEKERAIILQALFSRADTGLIKGDSSPTMPGSPSVVDKLFSVMGRK